MEAYKNCAITTVKPELSWSLTLILVGKLKLGENGYMDSLRYV